MLEFDGKDSETIGTVCGEVDPAFIGEGFAGIGDAEEITDGEGGDIAHLFVEELTWAE